MDVKERKQYQNLPKELNCTNCNTHVTAPMHCNHPMHVTKTDSGKEWNCWMGSSCGKKEYKACCDSPALTGI